MYPSVSEILKVESLIKSIITDRDQTKRIIKSDEKICLIHLPFIIDELDMMYAVQIDRDQALNATVNQLASLAQRHLNDSIHERVVAVIDKVILLGEYTIHPLTRISLHLCIDYESLCRIANALELEFEITISKDILFDFGNIASLEYYIRNQLAAKQ